MFPHILCNFPPFCCVTLVSFCVFFVFGHCQYKWLPLCSMHFQTCYDQFCVLCIVMSKVEKIAFKAQRAHSSAPQTELWTLSCSWRVDTYHRSNWIHWVTCHEPFWAESSRSLKLYSLTDDHSAVLIDSLSMLAVVSCRLSTIISYCILQFLQLQFFVVYCVFKLWPYILT